MERTAQQRVDHAVYDGNPIFSSLIICTRNRPQLLKDTVNSICEADIAPDELIIIDQSDEGSPFLNNRTYRIECHVHHVCIKTIGSSYARNMGARLANYEVLAFIDDDMIVEPHWFCSLIQTLRKHGPNSAVTGRVMPEKDDKPGQFVMAVHDWQEPSIYQGRIGKDVLASGLMAIYRATFIKIGGFDERLGPGTFFSAAEDNDLGYRLLEAGYKIVYTPDCIVYHRAWRSLSDYVPMYWRYGRGQGAFYAKHWNSGDPYIPSRARKDFIRFLKLIPQRIWKRQFLVLAGSTAFVLGEWIGAIQWVLHWRIREL